MSRPRVVVATSGGANVRAAVRETLEPLAEVVFLNEVAESERLGALRGADAVLGLELRDETERRALASARLIQLISAGVDRVAFSELPDDVPVASNAGAYAEPMAEHVLAMALALAKRLTVNHEVLRRGEWNQEAPTKRIHDSVVGILGFGGIGQASAELFRALGARVHAINRRGATDWPVEWVGTLEQLDELLRASDTLVVSLPLTSAHRGLIGARELALMKPDAVLVNVARGAILDEDALYEHLRSVPTFSAGIDTWWQEPHGEGSFQMRHPFLDLPNVLGSPHNSAIVRGALADAARQAAENIARHLRGEEVRHVVDRQEYVQGL